RAGPRRRAAPASRRVCRRWGRRPPRAGARWSRSSAPRTTRTRDRASLRGRPYTTPWTAPDRPPRGCGSGRCPVRGTSSRCLRALTNDGPRVLLELDALVGGLADEAVGGPAGELGADDELRAQPLRLAHRGPRGWRRERQVLGGKRRDGGQELLPVGVGEPGPD